MSGIERYPDTIGRDPDGRALAGAGVFPGAWLMADSGGMAGGDGGAGPDAGPGQRWDVALSFAGAQRDYVGQVAAALKAQGVRCFYDVDEQVRLWGTHLAEELPRIYAEESAAVVVFISADYASGEWTRLERRAALGRAVHERREYVLPARFDDTPLPGLLSDVVSVDLRGRAPGQFAEMVAAKLAGLDITAPLPAAAPVPLAGPADLVLTVTGGQVRGHRRSRPGHGAGRHPAAHLGRVGPGSLADPRHPGPAARRLPPPGRLDPPARHPRPDPRGL